MLFQIFLIFPVFLNLIEAFDKELLIKNTAKLNVCPCINLASPQDLGFLKSVSDFTFLTLISPDDCPCSLNIVLNVRNVSNLNFSNPRKIWLLFAEQNINTSLLFSGVDVPFNSAVFLIKPGVIEELYRVTKSFPLHIHRIKIGGGKNLAISRSRTRFDMQRINFTVGAQNVSCLINKTPLKP